MSSAGEASAEKIDEERLEPAHENNSDDDDDETASVVSAATASTLLYAMEKKYMAEQHVEPFINLFGTSPCKLANEKSLRLLVLNHKHISGVGKELLRFASYAKNVNQLDVAYNELRRWGEIANLLSALPQLRVLNLSHNPIDKEIALKCGPRALPIMAQLHTLILNGVGLPFDALKHFTATMPALKELHLSDTPLEEMLGHHKSEEAICSSVATLHVNACSIGEWPAVLRLLKLFPGAQHLYLAENPIAAISAGSAAGDIRSLVLSQCRISDWTDVEALSSMPRLESLRLRQVPLLEGLSEEERFHLVVGRLASLKVLNGSNISAQQREDSERFFIRYYMERAPDQLPPIYEELVNRHGRLEKLVKVDFTPRRFAKVHLVCEELSYRVSIRLRLNSTVRALMKYAAEATHIPVSRMRIFYVTHGEPTELRLPTQSLLSLHIEDGDEFFVQSKIVATPKR